MNNQLVLNSLKIYTNSGKVAYYEKFKAGINIIRGENSSGKSTISHFIFYVLGGAFNNWVDEALECNSVLAEVNLNGIIAVLKREVSTSSNQPMYIYWGALEEATKSTEPGHWTKFPYSATSNKKSLSNVLFEKLNIPTVYGEANITMHQILRLLYIDQDSPTNSLFFYEQFDTSLTRKTIAELLLGIYNEKLYENRLTKRELTKKVEILEGEIKGMKRLSENPLMLQPSHLLATIDSLRSNKDKIAVEIENLKSNKKRAVYTKKSKLEFQVLQKKALELRREVEALDEKIFSLEYEIQDTTFFLEMLESKIQSIKNSLKTKERLNDFPLVFCPECLSSLEKTNEDNCGLCKQPLESKNAANALSKMQQEISFQIIESKRIRERQINELADLRAKKEKMDAELTTSQKAVNHSIEDVQSVRDERIDSLLVEIGEIDGQIMQFTTLLETATKFQQFQDDLLKHKARLKELNEVIKHQEFAQSALANSTSEQIEEFALDLLHEDLNREDGFKEAESLKIDYGSNAIYVDDRQKRFSASSNFYLKNTVRFALFFASLELPEMRFPRFILCDNMEDNGIEERRAKNFQRLIINKAEAYPKKSYQIIYTTSYIPEEFNNSEYCVGKFYSNEGNNKTLNIF
ncbi:hypothetical protein K8089_02870 [Aequorivita sp. F47161]|uniref:AAA domain-containing protein n=1 Tax=Aequorivita vitellina TaxID=2874475 RepID=A0A9X1U0Q4_9FLAO|nr:hypothetical protein [Aequorivita vitellina]MCG2417950.1 hypothetical protein [Aequorivita vitellina]